MPISVKFNDKEVRRQPQRGVVSILSLLGVLLAVVFALVVFFIAGVVCLVNLPLHFLLKLLDGRGLVRPYEPKGGFNMTWTIGRISRTYSVPWWLGLIEIGLFVWLIVA